jgi:hypothetical protein
MSVIVQNIIVTIVALGAIALMVRRMVGSSSRKSDAALPCAKCAAHEQAGAADQRPAVPAGSMNTERARHAVVAVESQSGSPRGPVPSGRPGTVRTTASR